MIFFHSNHSFFTQEYKTSLSSSTNTYGAPLPSQSLHLIQDTISVLIKAQKVLCDLTLPAPPTFPLFQEPGISQTSSALVNFHSQCPRLKSRSSLCNLPNSHSIILIQVKPHFLSGVFPDFRIKVTITILDTKGILCPE